MILRTGFPFILATIILSDTEFRFPVARARCRNPKGKYPDSR